MSIDRRMFRRMLLSESAIAVDKTGRELGPVKETSGGGMMVTAASPEIAESLTLGSRLLVTVMEPGTQTSHTIDMVVRYCEGQKVGLEFVTGNES